MDKHDKGLWEKTKDVSAEAWDKTKEMSAKAWDATKNAFEKEDTADKDEPEADSSKHQMYNSDGKCNRTRYGARW
jgi:hypothetical protein